MPRNFFYINPKIDSLYDASVNPGISRKEKYWKGRAADRLLEVFQLFSLSKRNKNRKMLALFEV